MRDVFLAIFTLATAAIGFTVSSPNPVYARARPIGEPAAQFCESVSVIARLFAEARDRGHAAPENLSPVERRVAALAWGSRGTPAEAIANQAQTECLAALAEF